MAWVDYVLIAIVLISVLMGALRGFVREVLSLATWIGAFFAALRYGPQFNESLKSTIASSPIRLVAGYCLPFFGVLLVGGLLIWAISWAVRGAGLSPVDRMLGSGFGLLRGVFIVLALVIVAGLSALGREPWWKESQRVPQIQPFAKDLQALIPPGWLTYLRAQQASSPATVPQREK
jgi:membrane protein required for colicin V production